MTTNGILHTDKDVQQENALAAKLSEKWKCEFNRFPQMARVDWFLSRGEELLAFLEMKRRYCKHDQFPTVFFDFPKWAVVTEMSRAAGCKGYVVWEFDDGIWLANVDDIDPRVAKVTGRKDRGLASDFTPAIEIHMDVLTQVTCE